MANLFESFEEEMRRRQAQKEEELRKEQESRRVSNEPDDWFEKFKAEEAKILEVYERVNVVDLLESYRQQFWGGKGRFQDLGPTYKILQYGIDGLRLDATDRTDAYLFVATLGISIHLESLQFLDPERRVFQFRLHDAETSFSCNASVSVNSANEWQLKREGEKNTRYFRQDEDPEEMRSQIRDNMAEIWADRAEQGMANVDLIDRMRGRARRQFTLGDIREDVTLNEFKTKWGYLSTFIPADPI